MIILDVFVSCVDNTGMGGRVDIVRYDTTDDLEVRLIRNSDGAFVKGAIMTAGQETHFFTNVPDGDYTLENTNLALNRAYTPVPVMVACLIITQPWDTETPDYFFIYKAYSNPVFRNDDAANFPNGFYEYDGFGVRFDTKTEKTSSHSGLKRISVDAPKPVTFNIEDVKGNPFYKRCITGTTNQYQFFHAGKGLVTRKLVENVVECGFVVKYGCTNPDARNYDPTATIDDGSCDLRPIVYGCTDPTATNYNSNATHDNGTCDYTPVARIPIASVPLPNSLRYVRVETADNCSIFKTLDNTLFCQEEHNIRRKAKYYQKVARCDVHTIQVRTNYANVSYVLKNFRTNAVVTTIIPEIIVANTGETEVVSGYMVKHSVDSMRVYLTDSIMPYDIGAGDKIKITILGNSTVYKIREIKADVELGVFYAVIGSVHPFLVQDKINIDVSFIKQGVDYNIMQGVINWALYPVGEYYVQIVMNDVDFATAEWISEPVALRDNHPMTVCIDYKNIDNAFDVVYTTGIQFRVRVEGNVFQRVTAGTRTIHREPFNKVTKLRGTPYRKVRLNLMLLPPYLHERLAVILDHDMFAVNGVLYQTEDAYPEPEYNALSSLATVTVVIEQTEWFKDHNDHDLGNVDGDGLLIANNGFIKL